MLTQPQTEMLLVKSITCGPILRISIQNLNQKLISMEKESTRKSKRVRMPRLLKTKLRLRRLRIRQKLRNKKMLKSQWQMLLRKLPRKLLRRRKKRKQMLKKLKRQLKMLSRPKKKVKRKQKRLLWHKNNPNGI